MAAGNSGPRLGILGGTFDPIHYGHLRLAEEVGETLNLEHIYLIPAALPPHKRRRSVSAFEHRLEMTRIASAESPRLKVLDIQARRQGFSYSLETLNAVLVGVGGGQRIGDFAEFTRDLGHVRDDLLRLLE